MARDSTESTLVPAKIPFWHDPTKLAIIYQVVVLGMVGFLGFYLFTYTLAKL